MGKLRRTLRQRYCPREGGRSREVGEPVVSAVSAGSHEGKDVLTGSHEERNGM